MGGVLSERGEVRSRTRRHPKRRDATKSSGARRQHRPDYPLQGGRRPDECARRGGEELLEAEAVHHRQVSERRAVRSINRCGCGRGLFPWRPRPPVGPEGGYTFLEIVVVSAVVCILAGITVPRVLAAVDRSRGAAAVRYLAARIALARAHAVGRSTTVALRFHSDNRGTWFSVVEDGNGDCVRTRDIDHQIDRVVDTPVLLSDLFPGVSIGLAEGTPATDAVALGGTTILSFRPNGTATSGSVYVVGRDRTQWAVRVLGATARARVLRYDRAGTAWVNAD